MQKRQASLLGEKVVTPEEKAKDSSKKRFK